MQTISKSSFLEIVKFKPGMMIGKRIVYGKNTPLIRDISLSGEYILLEIENIERKWFKSDTVDDPVIIDTTDYFKESCTADLFTFSSLIKFINDIKSVVGNPNKEQSKSLFEIVEAINKDVLELRLKLENREIKEKGYDID